MQRVVAAVLLLAAAPLLLIAGILIARHSPGPLLFVQAREGAGGRIFRMFKLRTMAPGAGLQLDELLRTDDSLRQEWERFGCLRQDPRVAGPVSRLARRFSVDELPQLLNVVRGEMRLVGPRPLPPELAATLPARTLEQRRSVSAGMTGLWQVCGRSEMSLRRMGRLDVLYVCHRSPCLDAWILLRTVPAVLRGRGAV